MRDELVKILYDSLKSRLTISLADFTPQTLDWDLIPLKEKDALIGVVAAKQNHLHIGYSIKPKASIRGHLRQTLKKVLDTYGFATTVVVKGNEKSLSFCSRLGFKIIAEENGVIRMRCDRSDYV